MLNTLPAEVLAWKSGVELDWAFRGSAGVEGETGERSDEMSKERDLVRAVAEPIVLRLLSEREMYGYEIIKVVRERSGKVFDWKEGTLYPCLHRLEGQGLVKGEWKPAGKQRRRKYYRLTRKGHGVLKERLAEWESFSQAARALLSQFQPV